MIGSMIDVDGLDEIGAWVQEFEVTHPMGQDPDRFVYDTYRIVYGRPQYAVIDRNFDVVHVGRYHDEAEIIALDLL